MIRILWLLSLIVFAHPIFSQEVLLDSKIDSITLFRAGAQVSRSGSGQIAAGRSEVIFKGLSSEIDENSLRVSGLGDFTILSVTNSLDFLDEKEKTEKVKALRDQQKLLTRKINLTQKQLDVFRKEEKFLDKNMVKIMGVENTPATPDDVRQLADFHRKRMMEVLETQMVLGDTIAQLKERSQKLGMQIQTIEGKRTPPTGEVKVVVNSARGLNAKFNFNYFVRSASWQPIYEARVENISSPIVLNQKAKVTQNTGENWENIQLTLSTGNPTLGGVKPDLQPRFLDFYHPYANRNSKLRSSYRVYAGTEAGYVIGTVRDPNTNQVLIGASIVFSGTQIGTISDIDGKFKLKIPPKASNLEVSYTGYNSIVVPITSYAMGVTIYLGESGMSLDEVVVTGYGKNEGDDLYLKGSRSASNFYMVDGIRVQGGLIADEEVKAQNAEVSVNKSITTFNYTIGIPVSVMSNNLSQTIDIQEFSLPANYQYYAVPKLDTDAFLVGEITNWEQYGLLSAETSLFFEGTYLGKSFLDFETVEDTIALSLGRDKNIVIERKKVRDFTKNKFLNTNRVDTRKFEISVVNKKSQAISLRIEDQFPISKNKKIQISERKYNRGKLDEDTGLVKWNLDLPANGREKLELSYKVKYPKNRRVQLE